ncbi:MAG: putative phage tail protein [Limnochordales bacterium]
MDRVAKYWPEWLAEIRDFAELAATESIELDQLAAAIQQLLDDQFVETAGPEAIERRERAIGIQVDPTTETLEFRRTRLLNRYQTKPPFTLRYLQRQLDLLAGPGRAVANVDVQNYLLTITAAIEDAAVFREIERTIAVIKPANLVYQQRTALMETVGVRERISMHHLQWQTKLGSWRLGVTPFATLGDEVVIK